MHKSGGSEDWQPLSNGLLANKFMDKKTVPTTAMVALAMCIPKLLSSCKRRSRCFTQAAHADSCGHSYLHKQPLRGVHTFDGSLGNPRGSTPRLRVSAGFPSLCSPTANGWLVPAPVSTEKEAEWPLTSVFVGFFPAKTAKIPETRNCVKIGSEAEKGTWSLNYQITSSSCTKLLKFTF